MVDKVWKYMLSDEVAKSVGLDKLFAPLTIDEKLALGSLAGFVETKLPGIGVDASYRYLVKQKGVDASFIMDVAQSFSRQTNGGDIGDIYDNLKLLFDNRLSEE